MEMDSGATLKEITPAQLAQDDADCAARWDAPGRSASLHFRDRPARRALARIVERWLFWYTHSIHEFNGAAARAIHHLRFAPYLAQEEERRRAEEAERALAGRIGDLERRLRELERRGS